MFKKQAVVVIHGIGEQRPMSTLRPLVEALVGDNYQSKPDKLSTSFELRRLNYRDEKADTDTHFYEYYWAYRMRETRFRHVLDWSARMLWPPKRRWLEATKKVPPQHPRLSSLLRAIWLLLVGFLLITIALMILNVPITSVVITIASGSLILLIVSQLVRSVVSGFVLGSIGDAARYLNSAPGNIAERNAIKADGIALLKQLHENGYDRIVVLGHSLGSVIGYDILKNYWAEVNNELRIDEDEKSDVFKALKCVEHSSEPIEKFQENQFDLWKLLRVRDKKEVLQTDATSSKDMDDRKTTLKWSVSDFVTLGSPLSYGAFVLAESSDDLKKRTDQRELPVCPPTQAYGPNDKGRRDGYAYRDKEHPRVLYLHHAAHFAVTRWTNFYFYGDLIGGEVAPVFGRGVMDVPLEDGLKWFKSRAHTRYWRTDTATPRCLDDLKKIIFDAESWPKGPDGETEG